MTNSPALTYCGNVHPATDVDSWLELTERFSVPLAAAQRADGADFGLGTWWNAQTAAGLLEDDGEISRVRDFLVQHDLPIWTVNVFPYGEFHGAPVKERVYCPDWTTKERLRFTVDVATVVARLSAEMSGSRGNAPAVVPMSTLPLGYEAAGEDAGQASEAHAGGLVAAVRHLHRLRGEFGVHLKLALEPEPFCLVETVAQTAAFLEREVFLKNPAEEAMLRDHLGVCVDLCHLAVVGEDPADAVRDLVRRGIPCPKIQVSSCLEVRDPSGLDELLAFDESVYLHQTVAANGARALDLPEVSARREDFLGAGVLRTHFHMPVFWDQPGAALGSTREHLLRALADLTAQPEPMPLLEVETYTWGVLPGWDKSDRALLDGIAEELSFVRSALRPRSG